MTEISEFHKAVTKNQVPIVKRFLKDGESPDSLAIVLAIQNKAHNVLKALIDAGADVNKTEAFWGYTPLVRALYESNLVAFRILLNAGASVNKPHGQTQPLHCAAEEGLAEFIKLCVAAGAKVDQRNSCGNTPLMLASSMGHLDAVKLLIEAGANPLALNRAARTPCQLAAENDEMEVVLFLEPFSQRKAPIKRGVVALVQAVANQDMAAVEKCIAKGIDVNGRDRFGRSPLDKAIAVGAVPFVRRLIEAGINLNRVDPSGISFLEGALRAEQREVVKILLDSGAVPDPPGNRFEDAIYTACCVKDVELVKLLMRKGSNPKVSGAIIPAARNKSLDLVKVLLEAGADVNHTDDAGRTPLFWAVFRSPVLCTIKNVSTGSTLISTEPSLQVPDDVQAIKVAKLLLEHGADVNRSNDLGRTPLTYASSVGMAKLLIEAGARLDSRDGNGHDVAYWLEANGIEIVGDSARRRSTCGNLSPKIQFKKRLRKRGRR